MKIFGYDIRNLIVYVVEAELEEFELKSFGTRIYIRNSKKNIERIRKYKESKKGLEEKTN